MADQMLAPAPAPNTNQTRLDQALQISSAVQSWYATITQRPIIAGPSYAEQTIGVSGSHLSAGFLIVVGVIAFALIARGR